MSGFSVVSEFSLTPSIGQASILSAFSYKDHPANPNDPELSIPFRRTYFRLPLGELTSGSFSVSKCVGYGISSITVCNDCPEGDLLSKDIGLKADHLDAHISQENVPESTAKAFYLSGEFYVDVPATLRLQCLINTSGDAVFTDQPLSTAKQAMEVFPSSSYSHGKDDHHKNIFASSGHISYPSPLKFNKAADDISFTVGGYRDKAEGGLVVNLNKLSRKIVSFEASIGTDVSWVIIDPLFSMKEKKTHEFDCVTRCGETTADVKVAISGNYEGYTFTTPLVCDKDQDASLTCSDLKAFPGTPGIPAVAKITTFANGETYSMYGKNTPVVYRSGADVLTVVSVALFSLASFAAMYF